MTRRKVPMTTLAWMAGILEVRGRVKRYESNSMRNSTQLTVRVHSKQLPLVERLGELTGVKVRSAESKMVDSGDRRGCIEHCPEAHVHLAVEMPSVAMWVMTGVPAAVVLYNLLPYLVTDKDRLQRFVDEAIEQLPTGQQGRHAIMRAVERLHNLGWTVPAEVDEWMKPATVTSASAVAGQ